MLLKWKTPAMCVLAGLLVCMLVSGAAAASQNYKMERSDYIAYLKKHTQSDVMERWRGDVPVAGMDDIRLCLEVFDYWTHMVLEGQRHKLVGNEPAMLEAFKAKAREIQSAAFPKLRQALENVDVAELGKSGVVVRLDGEKSRNVVFVGRTFIEGDQSRFFDDNLKQLLQLLRFDQASYEVLDGNGSRTETLDLTSFGDDELAVFNTATGKFRPVK